MGNDKQEPFITLNFPEPIGERSFDSKEALVDFAEGEKKFWSAYINEMKTGSHDNSKETFRNLLNSIHSESNKIPENPSVDQKQGLLDKFNRAINNGFIFSESFDGQFIDDLGKRYSNRAVGAATAYIFIRKTQPSVQIDDDAQFGIFLGRLYSEGAIPKSMVENLERQATGAKDTIAKVEGSIHQKLDEMSELYQLKKNNFEQLEKTYGNQLKLEYPADYWTSKKQWHYAAATIIAGISIWGACDLGSMLIDYHQMNLLKIDEVIARAGAQMNWWLIVVYSTRTLIPALALLWLLRIMVRLFLSQIHLGTDAAERSVLITTWLAMLKNNGVLEERERWVVLHQIFRHGATGIVKEDLSPHFLAKWIDGTAGSDNPKSS